MATPVLQLTRLTNAGRLADRFLACQVRDVFDPGHDSQARLMCLVEVHRPWLTASQIGQALIHAFNTGYRDAQTTADDAARVEAALRHVNETLVHLTQQGETDWINHLHAVFVLERSGDIHVAHTGRAGVFLCRDGQISRVTELEGAQSAAGANRTFANITSGQLDPGDSFLIASAEFTKTIPLEGIEAALTTETPAEAAHHFARIIRQHQSQGAAAIIVRAHDPRVLESQPLVSEPDVVYLDQEPIESLTSTLATLGRRAKKALVVVGHSLNRTGRRVDNFARESVAPKGKELASQGLTAGKAHYTRFRTEVLPDLAKRVVPATKALRDGVHRQTQRVMASLAAKRAKSPIEAKADDTVPPAPATSTTAQDSGLIGMNLYTVRDYTESKPTAKRRLSFRFPTKPWSGLSNLVTTFKNKRWRPRLYIAAAVVLIIILIANIYSVRAKQGQKTSNAQAVSQLSDLNQRFSTIKVQIAFKKNDQTSNLNDLLAAVTPLTKIPGVADQATALELQVQDALDSATNSSRIRSPKLIAAFPSPAVGLFRLGSDLVTTKQGASDITSSPLAGALLDTRASFPSGTNMSTATSIDNTADPIIFLTAQGTAMRMVTPGTSPTAVSLAGGSWEPAVAMASFGNTLYLLDPSGNQIWKHATSGDDYVAGTKYISDSSSVSQGISLAIDGSVYVLNQDGSVIKLTRGKKDSFSVKNLPNGVTISDARAIWTNADATSVYVLTKTGVVELGKDGAYIRRYVSTTFTNLTAFVINPTAKQAWVLNDSTVYRFDLSS